MRFPKLFSAVLVITVALCATAQVSAAPKGSLTQLSGKAGCFIDPQSSIPRNGCAKARGMMSAQTVVLSPDGRNLYAPGNVSWGVADFRRNAKSGTLRQLPGASGCFTSQDFANGCTKARGMVWSFWGTVSPDGRNVYVTGGIGYQLAVFQRNPATGALTQPAGPAGCLHNGTGGTKQGGPEPAASGCTLVDNLEGPRSLVVSPDGGYLYVANLRGDTVTIFKRDPATGFLSALPNGCISGHKDPGCIYDGALNGPTDVALSPDARFLYVTGYTNSTVSVFSRDPGTGLLAPIAGAAGCASQNGAGGCSSTRGMKGTYNIALSKDGRNIYVAARGSKAVAVLNRDGATGALSQPGGPAGCVANKGAEGCAKGRGLAGARGVAVAPDGKSVYAGSYTDNAVTAFARNPANGAIEQLPGKSGCLSYVGRKGKKPLPGCGPGRAIRHSWGIAISADGRYVYTTAAGDGNSGLAVFRRK